MNFVKAFAQQPRKWILAEMGLALVVIGTLDFVTTYELRLLPLYAGPIFVVGWFFGKRSGFATAVASSMIWWTANWFNGDPDLHNWVQAWEITRHVGFFLVVGWTGATLRNKDDMATARIALLEHSRQLEEEIVQVSEAEQQRIGQDLHDGLCQFLAALSCSATALRGQLEKQHLVAESAHADDLARLLQSAVVETRDLARSLVPAHLNDVGLVVALDALAQSVTRLHRINCTFRFDGKGSDDDERVAVHFYRIAQEAISNALKHGKAQNIAIYLEETTDCLELRITDDGVGILENPGANGMGLAVMRYRARLSGGELSVDRLEEGGTRISCAVRMNDHESVAA